MDEIFRTGPGFYCGETNKNNQSIPIGKMRLYMCRLECYDINISDRTDLDTSFDLLVAKAENDPKIAMALIQLVKSVGENMNMLKECANKELS